ncbi:MAG: hypothetical protein IJP92_02100 [Lachnospiraceae bacterium]|nr:hypothetical protein [Lachnospiraceae bacterium]
MKKAKQKTLFNSGSVLHAVLTLAIPTVIGQIILVIYNIADTYFVSLTGRDDYISAVTVCLPAFMFLSAISNLFGIGASSTIGRAMGKGKIRRARRTAAFSFWGCFVTTLFYCLLALLLIHPFVRILGGLEENVHVMAVSYMEVTVVIGGLCASLNALMAHLFRSEGRSIISAVGISLGGFLNIALDPLFMFVLLPEGGEVLGAAIATTLSNALSFLYFLIAFLRLRKKKTVLSLKISPGRVRKTFKKHIPKDVFAAGAPACLMTLFENVSYAVLGNLMAHVSVAAHAGIGVAKKINMLAHCIVRGIAQGVLPLIAYNYAAKDQKRMQRSLLVSMTLAVGAAALCTAACLIFSMQLTGIFFPGVSESHSLAAKFLRILCIGGPFSACAYLMISFFQAVGQGLRSFFLAVLRKGALDIPMMLVFASVFGAVMIVWATPLADMICCLTALVMFFVFQRKQLAKAA